MAAGDDERLADDTNGGEAIRAERAAVAVVVVEVAARALIPRIVRNATIRRAEAHTLRRSFPVDSVGLVCFIDGRVPTGGRSNSQRLLPVFKILSLYASRLRIAVNLFQRGKEEGVIGIF